MSRYRPFGISGISWCFHVGAAPNPMKPIPRSSAIFSPKFPDWAAHPLPPRLNLVAAGF